MQAVVASCFRKGNAAAASVKTAVGYALKNPKMCIAGTVAAVAGLDALPHILGNMALAPLQAVGLGSPNAEDQATAQVITAFYAGLAWYYWPKIKQAYTRVQAMAAQ
jgi:hypothetical protein